ncbi:MULTISPECIES: hypothetical protein [Streptomyces]|uniref:MmyB-like transcription regulator ligand binding domain-containing protein n=1 Tax=Streptomyces lycii TaxID=2654337 RepID=A0ABQ7FMF0_9ACTN|nr:MULTISPECIES: hypothetical protein [Streptomyces]KAF4409580.1 hypothetical protein GCU69_08165 [Streptomyces lycii]PGH49576.1 hypothetical protein CRI70_16775 [Streptomyces sp. Ru87]
MGTPTTVAGDPGAGRGLRISRVPGQPVRRDAGGSLIIPLWLRRDGVFDADLALRLSPAEAELLHAQLCFALDDVPGTYSPAYTPDCLDPRGPSGPNGP